MNIGHLYGCNAYPPQGGDGVHVYQLVQWFIKRGHTVHTIGDSHTPWVERYPSDDAGINRFVDHIDILYTRIDGWYFDKNPIRKACLERASVPIVWEINAPANEMLARYALGLKSDAGGGIRKFASRFKRKMEGINLLPSIYRDEAIRRRYAQKVDAAVCVSDALERYARESLEIQRTYVLPNGSDPDLFSPNREPIHLDSRYKDHFKLLYAGSPRYPWQGLDILQNVVAKVGRTSNKILFMFVVNQGSLHIPQGENVLAFEKVSYFDVARYMLAADACLCIHPDYTWSKWGFHGSSTKLFDYMACGKPVIASKVGQIQTVIDDNKDGLLTDNHPDDVVQKILYLYEHREKAKEMGMLAREKVLRYYNWERVADATLEILASIQRERTSLVGMQSTSSAY